MMINIGRSNNVNNAENEVRKREKFKKKSTINFFKKFERIVESGPK